MRFTPQELKDFHDGDQTVFENIVDTYAREIIAFYLILHKTTTVEEDIRIRG